ncbi:glycosyltransferase [Candidatus Pelagibacter sp.]|nr:glycosyltransferase [Candidatus Pelagibacter sp.]|tara:strand:+ start:87 stop:1226 length:1140 start_codon:yes stop_codon:yes gene_type:complete
MKKNSFNIVIDASRNKSGGAIVYLKNFLKHLDIKNTKINKILIFSHKRILKQIPNRPFLIKCSHYLLEKNIFFQIIWQLIFLPMFLKKNKIDILYSTDSSTFCNYSPSIVFNQDILSFDKEALNQIPFSLEKIRLYIIKYVQIYSMNNANEVIFLSKNSRKTISKYLKKKTNHNIIHHGAEEYIKKIRKRKNNNLSWNYNSKSKIKIVYVSPLFKYKNHSTVAKAYSRLKNKYKNLDIKFIGNYEHNLNLLNNIINENPIINKSHFVGEINQQKVIKNLINSDIFVFASSSETFGISLVEAMAIGMPIVCSNKSSLPEILEDGGLYFNPKNDLQLSKQIELFIKDKALRKKKASKAKKISSKFSWNKNTKEFCNLINKF